MSDIISSPGEEEYFDLGGGHTGLYICKNSLSCVFQICVLMTQKLYYERSTF